MKKFIYLTLVLLLIVAFAGVSFAAKPDQSKAGTAYVGSGDVYLYKGAGTMIGISTNGSLIYFESPLGYEHIWAGTEAEGYALCYGPTTGNENSAYDVHFDDSGISLTPLPSTALCGGLTPGGTNLSPDGNGCSNYPYRTSPATAPTVLASKPLNVLYFTKTADNTLRIMNRFQWDGVSRTITVTMTVRNISTSSVKVTLKRWVDFDVDVGGSSGHGDYDLNWHGRSYDSIFAWNDPADFSSGHKIELRAISHIPTLSNVDWWWTNYYTCPTDTTDGPTPQTNQDDNAGSIEWNLGTLAPGAEATRVMRYTVSGM